MTSVVYFVENSKGHIKIGCTSYLAGRMKALRRAYGRSLKLLAVTPGNALTESRLHREFDAYSLGGEWCRPNASLLRVISELPAATTPVEPVSPFAVPPKGKAGTYAFVRGIARELIELRGPDVSKTGFVAETARDAGVSDGWLRKLLGEQEDLAIGADAMISLISLYRRRLLAAELEARAAIERHASRREEADAWLLKFTGIMQPDLASLVDRERQ